MMVLHDKLPRFNMPGFLIGNGISRRDLDLNELKGRGLVGACNYFFREGYDFSEHPFFLGLGDPEPACGAYNSGYWLHHNIVVHSSSQKRVTACGIKSFTCVRRKIPEFDSSGSMGGFMLRFLLALGCAPIFLLGMGDKLTKIDDDWVDNIHPNGTYRIGAHGYRSYDNPEDSKRRFTRKLDQQVTKHNAWKSHFFKTYQGNSKRIFKVGTKGGYDIPHVNWNDLLGSLPIRWGVEIKEFDGIKIRIPKEL